MLTSREPTRFTRELTDCLPSSPLRAVSCVLDSNLKHIVKALCKDILTSVSLDGRTR